MNTVIRSHWLNLQKCGTNYSNNLTKRLLNSQNQKTSSQSHEVYCMELVRKRDWEGYIASLLLPKSSRRSVFAIRAFNSELSQIGGSVSEVAIGHMRLHFWKQCLESVYDGKPPESPVALELHRAITAHNLSKIWMKRMIEAREDYIEGQGFKSIRELEDYADNTSTAQLCLTLQCLGIEDVNSDHVASHIGKAQGIITTIRSTPYHAARRKVQLPTEFLSKHLVSQEQIFRGSEEQNVRDLIYDLASQAHIHLQHARDIAIKIPRKAKIAFLNTASMDWYLERLRLGDFNVFHPHLQRRNDKLPFTVFCKFVLKKF
uniref:NADH dehydrogenase (ubiquinone) complex I, assembly factor 6-like n=1 Tax=Styela clava TaxID=7725 RepID=UPI00193A399C|nr:NADH dehydrogenase (ubiquinone) complex I, assembly factor 6-like [Styela clava]